jgi:phosphate starvation-inducible membrane PsiE
VEASFVLEAGGDAIVRLAIYDHVGLIRIGVFLAGAALLSVISLWKRA